MKLSMSRLAWLAGACVIALPAAAGAATLRVRCERVLSPASNSISLDGSNLPVNAVYSARVLTGARQATARPPLTALGDEVGFDFDSDAADIARGATRIAATFIVNNTVRGVLFDAAGHVAAGPTTATCTVR